MSCSCIYIWRNKINNKLYCGQTRNLTKRNYRYKIGYFPNKHFEYAVKKYGFSNFEQTIIETSPENLRREHGRQNRIKHGWGKQCLLKSTFNKKGVSHVGN